MAESIPERCPHCDGSGKRYEQDWDATDMKDILDPEKMSTEFNPYCEPSPEADAINVYFRSDADYSERLTDHVTLFRSLDDKSIIGCRIKGIGGLPR